ncbi:MAG: hypothetical protein CMJ47_08505 [Planctomyces sp.]|nr:hypothetical protein [Planctomyces sp.]
MFRPPGKLNFSQKPPRSRPKSVSIAMNYRLICLLVVVFAGLTLSGCESESKPGAAIWYEPEEQTETLPAEAEPVAEAETAETAPPSPEPVNTPNNNTDRTADARFGIGAPLNGFRPFPNDDAWNRDISQSPVDPQSDDILTYIGLDGHLHPDFGSGEWEGSKIGIPYVVVPGDQPRVEIRYGSYADESDPGPFPLPFNTPVEGDPYDRGDRHAIVIDRDNWKLYELYRAFPINGGASWRAESGAVFDLKTNTERPRGWTSADAAGLPIFPGLVRYDEVGEQQEIRHALRFTLNDTRRAFVPPSSHWASPDEHPLLPPLGMRVRLKADVPIDGYPASVQVILRALKKYGMILADNGSDWFISGAPDERWDNDALRTLRKVRISDLEIIRMDGLVTPYTF